MFTKMNDLAAKQICNWKYEHPYSVYNYMEYDEAVKKCAAIVNPEKAENFLCFWDKNVLIAYINIYTMEEKIYIGIGLSPVSTGTVLVDIRFSAYLGTFSNPMCLARLKMS